MIRFLDYAKIVTTVCGSSARVQQQKRIPSKKLFNPLTSSIEINEFPAFSENAPSINTFTARATRGRSRLTWNTVYGKNAERERVKVLTTEHEFVTITLLPRETLNTYLPR